ncbi:MAG TPA: hypothetical protein VHT30_05265 [Acidimicrobiales bacterium]|nr:hypothetical protein [Acidimicrobiales bacterium]
MSGSALLLVLSVGSASAATITNPSQNPFPVPNLPAGATAGSYSGDVGSFPISFSGFPPNTPVYAIQCDGESPTAPTYDPTVDCDAATEPHAVVSGANGAGSWPAYQGANSFYAFEGDSPEDLFTCLYPGEATPPGTDNTVFTNCQLKLTINPSAFNATDVYLTLTLPSPSSAPAVPEVGTLWLLPATAALICGAAVVIDRRRNRPRIFRH